MTLFTAHRILIAAAVLLFVGYGAMEMTEYAAAGDPRALTAALASTGAAVVLALYWRTIPRA